MQMFFLKNMVKVFIVALILTGVFIWIIAAQRTPGPEEGAPDTTPQSEKAAPAPADLPEAAPEAAPETTPDDNNVFDPTETPEQRLVEELEKLDIIPEDVDNVPTVPQADNPPVAPQMDNPPVAPQMDNPPVAPQMDNSPVAPQMDNSPVAPQMDNSPVAPQMDNSPVAPQMDDALSPQSNEPDDQMNNQPPGGASEVPVRFETTPLTIKPTPIKITLKYDNDENPLPPEDPGDPTSLPTGPHGSHKGGPKVVIFKSIKSIPIIKMGENFEGRGEFKVITPGNS